MNVIVWIEGREAIPLRAIPFVTTWEAMSPDCLAQALARVEEFYQSLGFQAFRNQSRPPKAIDSACWVENVCATLKVLTDSISSAEISQKSGFQERIRDLSKQLPAGVFVRKNDFISLHDKCYGFYRRAFTESEVESMTAKELGKEGILNFSPSISDLETQRAFMDGFDAYKPLIDVVFVDEEHEQTELEKYRMLWRGVRFHEGKVRADIESLELSRAATASEMNERNKMLPELRAELAQIIRRKDMLASGVDSSVNHAAEQRYIIEKMSERRPVDNAFDATQRADEIREANEKIDALFASNTPNSPTVQNGNAFGGVELLPENEPRRNTATVPELSMTKAAMIAQHKHEWPTIVGDMSNAVDNKLASAKAGKRRWKEADAIAWAKANNKLISNANPADSLPQIMHNMSTLPTTRHKL
ncbi:MAG: hypothetical protein Q7L55_09095 [Actinomycetota bacterium]|nr:hypothetical protein [Actinomycetota bacterium]